MLGSSSKDIAAKTTLSVEGEVIPPRYLGDEVRAVNYDDYHQVYIDECREGGESVRTINGEGWISFHDVDFGNGASKFEARVSGYIPGGEIIITLDANDYKGQTVGKCIVPPTGGRQAWTTVSLPVEGLSGRHNVYLTLKGEVQVSWFRMV